MFPKHDKIITLAQLASGLFKFSTVNGYAASVVGIVIYLKATFINDAKI